MTRRDFRGKGHHPVVIRYTEDGRIAVVAIDDLPNQAAHEVIVSTATAYQILTTELHPMARMNRLIDDTLKKRPE